MNKSQSNLANSQRLCADPEGQWLLDVARCPSPNFDSRPPGVVVDLLVIHCISLPPGEFGTGCVQALFENRLDYKKHPYFESLRDLKVSAHLFIDRNGQVKQFVGLQDRAWHAGVSRFGLREQCNDFSVGIELEGTETSSYTDSQYLNLGAVCLCLFDLFPNLLRERVVAHSDIAPGRKTDPGPGFDWPRLRNALPR